MMEGGALVFHIRDPNGFIGKIFGWDDDRYWPDRVWVTQGRRTVASFKPMANRTGPCSPAAKFPLRIGEPRCGYSWSGTRSDLKEGVVYAIRLRAREMREALPGEDWSRDARSCVRDLDWSDSIMGAFVIESGGRVVNLRPREYPDECGTQETANGAVQEEWAEHCLAEPQREGINEQGRTAENRPSR